jgi:aldehyde:ferredoxin oxidoreductase
LKGIVTGGYVGKFLFVDLTHRELRWEAQEESIYRNFLGGYGVGVRVIYSRQAKGIHPFNQESHLGFVTGLLTGLRGLISPRYTVVGKSPLTGTWGDANSGGFFGPRLKSAGADAIFFFGSSPTPVYLVLENGKGHLVSADDIWGKDAVETDDALKRRLGKQAEVVVSGLLVKKSPFLRILCIE